MRKIKFRVSQKQESNGIWGGGSGGVEFLLEEGISGANGAYLDRVFV